MSSRSSTKKYRRTENNADKQFKVCTTNKIDYEKYTVNGAPSYLIEYYVKCKKGKQVMQARHAHKTREIMRAVEADEYCIIGRELMTQLDRLIDDLENDRYLFIPEDALDRIDFIETFCKHTKNPFNGQPFVLQLWQKAITEAMFAFKNKETGFNRFTRVFLLIARKNGKSTFCSALGLAQLMIGPAGTDIVCASNDDAQSEIIFGEIESMRSKFDPNNKRTRKNRTLIKNKLSDSSIKKLTDNMENKEGRNIDFAVIDEVHEMTTNTTFKAIEQSTSTKDEPMVIEITTEGFTNEGYLDQTLKRLRKILRGELEDETVLIWLYTQDSQTEIWQDKITWYKTNPTLGRAKKWAYMDRQMKAAQQSREDKAFTMSKDFNFKQSDAQAWLSEQEYRNETTFDLESLRGAVGIGGVDLAQTTDLASAKVIVRLKGSDVKYKLSMYFIPEGRIEEASKEDGVDYKAWAEAGMITVSPGDENDFSLISKWFYNYIYKRLGIRIYKVGYDNALATYWVNEMKDIGFDMERIRQNTDTLSDPMKLLGADLRAKRLLNNDNPVDNWCYGNTAVKIDNRARIYPIKVDDDRYRRIDGTLADADAYAVYIQNKQEYLTYVEAS